MHLKLYPKMKKKSISFCLLFVTVLVVLILRFWPGFLSTVAVFGITSLPSVEVRNLEGGFLLPKKKKETFEKCDLLPFAFLIAIEFLYTGGSKDRTQAQSLRDRKAPPLSKLPEAEFACINFG